MNVLLVEDSYMLADTLVSALKQEHFMVDVAYNGLDGYDMASSGIYDVAVLDLMLPQLNGYEILKKLRQEKNSIPILVLSAKSELNDKVLAFEYGADDYLTKPFEIKELIMRILALSRRKGEVQGNVLNCGNLNLDLRTCTMTNSETQQSVQLAGKEFQLMEYFLNNQNQIISREQIIERIWGFNSNSEYNNVEVYVSFLRKKISFIHANMRIRAVRGIGYTVEAES
ncbi:MAG: response regulator transcription factor [Lachnospiraceae bacterium]|nr:response regulator transcription factor [Lachnospiraceae bacterium]